ncbi:hypothetical protein SNEBB_003008 [Seison nebaliae]|nr:hypothetical protein SNEBB_003008 [Seison nebaliae]
MSLVETVEKPIWTKFVQVGRVVGVRKADDAMAVIVNVIDKNRALVDMRVKDSLKRTVVSLKGVYLSSIVVNGIGHQNGTPTVQKAIDAQEIEKKWNESVFMKRKVAKSNVENMDDYTRFLVDRLKNKKRQMIKKEVKRLSFEQSGKNGRKSFMDKKKEKAMTKTSGGKVKKTKKTKKSKKESSDTK